MTAPIPDLLSRVPWGKFFLLWFLAVLMGTSLLWLNFSRRPEEVQLVRVG